MITLLENLSAIVDEKKLERVDETELYQGLLGACMYCMDSIHQEYYLHSPSYHNGYIYDSGSPLYSLLSKTLDNRKDNEIIARDKLIYINKFHQMAEKQSDAIDAKYSDKDKFAEDLRIKIRDILRVELKALSHKLENVVNAIPTEKAMTKHMEELPAKYKEEKAKSQTGYLSYFQPGQNPNRNFFSQLVEAIATIKCDNDEVDQLNIIPHSQLIKMGAMLYISYVIDNEYYIRSSDNSVFKKLCMKVLNIPSIDSMRNEHKLAAVSAFLNHLKGQSDINGKQVSTVKFLQQYGATHYKDKSELNYFDAKLVNIEKTIIKFQSSIGAVTVCNWPATATLASVGMIIGAAPGYGVGSFVGTTVAATQPTLPAKTGVGQGFGNLATVVYGGATSAGYFAFIAGDFIVGSMITRAFAKMFEFVGVIIGGATGGLIGFTVDLSWKGLNNLCKYCLDVHEIHPELMKDVDIELIKAIMELPKELFPEDKQLQISYAQGLEDELKVGVRANPF